MPSRGAEPVQADPGDPLQGLRFVGADTAPAQAAAPDPFLGHEIRSWDDLRARYGSDLRIHRLEGGVKTWAVSHAVGMTSAGTGSAVLLYVQAAKGTVLLQQLRHKIHHHAGRTPAEHIISAALLQAIYDEEAQQASEPEHVLPVKSAADVTLAEQTFFELALRAVELNASDIHFRVRNDGGESAGQVLMRVDGELEAVQTMPPERLVDVIATAYAKSDMKSVAAGQGQFNLARPHGSFIRLGEKQKRIELRFQSNSERYGTDAVMRVLNFEGKNAVSGDLAASGYLPTQIEMFEEHGYGPGGSVLMIGETGSGKTTTLNCLLAGHPGVVSGQMYSSTVEDPPEGRPKGVSQFPVARSAEDGGSGGPNPFVTALKALMRMDGDLICLGEIRDNATAQMWQELCLTGHKIYATTHAPSSIGAIERLCSSLMGLHPETVASEDVLSLGAYQKLVPRLCPQCRTPATKSSFSLKKLERLEALGIDPVSAFVRNTTGCSACRGGKKGAQVIVEMFNPKAEQRRMIAKGQFSEAYYSWRETRGSTSFMDDKVQGKTAFEVALNYVAKGIVGVDTVDSSVGRILSHEVIGGVR
jgi:type II secretory ATPase GspE/PulE/Tfp pilus assembly ATPase PilB-like protein